MAARGISKSRTPFKTFGGSRDQLSMDPVEVFCRIKPINDSSVDLCVKALDEQTLQMTEPYSQENEDVKAIQAKFTYLFDHNGSQKDIFDRVALDTCEDVLQGRNGLLFTYGITGSGKTYTMTGLPSDVGLLPRCLDVIFNSIAEYQADPYVFIPDKANGFEIRSKVLAELDRARLNLCPTGTSAKQCFGLNKMKKTAANDWAIGCRSQERIVVPMSKFDEDNAFSVFVSYVEIYNNYIYDLLDPPMDKTKPPQSKTLREDANRSMYVSGVTEVEVRSPEDAFDVLTRGQKIRRVAHTLLNTESSRSHSVFNIRLVKAPLDETGNEILQDRNKVHVSQLSLVDLAGSERSSRTGNIGDRLRETGCINASLMCLRQCLEQLRENQKNGTDKMVPYRDSKMTHLFKNYFEGEGKVRMIVCVNPSSNEYDENVNVLKFAELTKDVRVMPSVAMTGNLDEFTPGRRRAAQICKEVQDEIARMLDFEQTRFADYVPDNYAAVNIPNFDGASFDLVCQEFVMYQQTKQARLQQMINQKNDLQKCLFEDLHKLVLEHECLKRKHEECTIYRKSMDREMQSLRSENLRMKQKMASYEFKIKRYEQDTKWMQSQEELLKRREREMAASVRTKDDKLRAVKDVFDGLPPAGSSRKQRAPSPPPKPTYSGRPYNQRPVPMTRIRQRRSKSIGDLTAPSCDENRHAAATSRRGDVTGILTPYCPARMRRVKQRENISSSSDSSGDGPVKRRSAEPHPIDAAAVKRGRDR